MGSGRSVRVGGDEPGAALDQPDRPGDRLEGVGAGLPAPRSRGPARSSRSRCRAGPWSGRPPRRRTPSRGALVGRNCAVASADVQIASSGTSMSLASSLARRSRGVNIELLVRPMNLCPDGLSASTNSRPPGIGSSSWTRTPSMSVSHVLTGRERLVVGHGSIQPEGGRPGASAAVHGQGRLPRQRHVRGRSRGWCRSATPRCRRRPAAVERDLDGVGERPLADPGRRQALGPEMP